MEAAHKKQIEWTIVVGWTSVIKASEPEWSNQEDMATRNILGKVSYPDNSTCKKESWYEAIVSWFAVPS